MNMRFYVPCVIMIMLMVLGCAKPAVKNQPSTELPSKSPAQVTEKAPVSAPEEPAQEEPTGPITSITTASVPEGWPEDVPIIKGLTIEGGIAENRPGGMLMVTARGDLSLDTVQDFYMNLKNWKKDERVPWVTTGSHRTLRYKKPEATLGISIMENEGKTQLVIQYLVTGPVKPKQSDKSETDEDKSGN